MFFPLSLSSTLLFIFFNFSSSPRCWHSMWSRCRRRRRVGPSSSPLSGQNSASANRCTAKASEKPWAPVGAFTYLWFKLSQFIYILSFFFFICSDNFSELVYFLDEPKTNKQKQHKCRRMDAKTVHVEQGGG